MYRTAFIAMTAHAFSASAFREIALLPALQKIPYRIAGDLALRRRWRLTVDGDVAT
jgi:hypothetical protein